MSDVPVRQIWKYTMSGVGEGQQVEMPAHAKIIHVASQNDRVCFWAIVDPKENMRTRGFIVIGTGVAFVGNELEFVGTCQTHDGIYVWHLFEATR